MSLQDLSQLSMLDLFRMEVDSESQALTAGLLALERDPKAADQLERCMRAAHSLKGAARIVGLTPGVEVAHALEECFVAAQRGAAVAEPDVPLQQLEILDADERRRLLVALDPGHLSLRHDTGPKLRHQLHPPH